MMKSEFMERTGFEPTDEEYKEIEEEYYHFDGNKDEFCREWVKQNGIRRLTRNRALKIGELKNQISRMVTEMENARKKAEKEVENLRQQLDRELEWKPCDCGTCISQTEYKELEECGGTRELTDEQAKELIHREFGFDPEQIVIIREVNTFESDKYHRIRIAGTWRRNPVYNASDWNYIRFDCAGWQWEMVNATLRKYDD